MTPWLQPTAAPKVPGYDLWLQEELAAALDELKAGKTTPIEDVRKEFGLE